MVVGVDSQPNDDDEEEEFLSERAGSKRRPRSSDSKKEAPTKPSLKDCKTEEERRRVVEQGIQAALTISGNSKVDKILDRQNPLPPALQQSEAEKNEETVGVLGPVGFYLAMSHSERVQLHADLYGRPPKSEEEMERLALELEIETYRIAEEERGALMKALECNPLLFIASPHIRFFLERDGRNAKKASKRLVRYWKQREAMFGEKAYSEGVFNAPNPDDQLRLYNRSLRIVSLTQEKLAIGVVSREYIRRVNVAKISYMDLLLRNNAMYGSALIEAQKSSPEGFTLDEHKIAFLHCEDLDEDRAVERMMRYWGKKLDLFGRHALHRNIYSGDMEDQATYLEHSFIRVMPGTDDHGRAIITVMPDQAFGFNLTERDIEKMVWYVFHASMSMLSDCIIIIDDSPDQHAFAKAQAVRQICMQYMFFIFPFKIKAIHLRIYNEFIWQKSAPFIRKVMGDKYFSRMIAHVGTNEEFVSELQKYGIPAKEIPESMGGNVGADYWDRWMMLQSARSPF